MNKIVHLLVTGLTITLFSGSVSSSPSQCGFQGAREISNASLHIAESSSFDSYRYLWVDEIRVHDNAQALKHSDQRHLRNLIKSTLEQAWQERLGWRSTATPGQAVASLSVELETPTNNRDGVRVHARLRDSLTGQQLMTQCGQELALELPSLSKQPQLAWHDVRQQVSYWGAGLGTHIMTVY